jgi:hypothetical protein
MANATSIQLMLDGPRNAVIKLEGVLDTSDVAQTVVVDPATLCGIDNTLTVKAAGFTIDRIVYNVEDTLAVLLFWDATVPASIEELTGRGHMEYRRTGGLPSNAGAGKTGKILMATQGWTTGAILSYSVVLELHKTQS